MRAISKLSMQGKLALPATLVSVLAASLFAWLWLREQNQEYALTLATGSRGGEYYAFGEALARVIAKHHPRIQIQVLETAGSLENQELLSQNRAQLAILQSDTPTAGSTEAIAILFPEMFHLLAAKSARIGSVSDLKGKRIALPPPGSGSYRLFWPLSSHYGLQKGDFQVITLPTNQAQAALRQGEVDALFRAIALGNPEIGQLLQDGQIELVPIEQGAALKLFQPALIPSIIPRGTYNGARPIPAADLPVVAVQALLVARQDLKPEVAYQITQVLFEARNELIKQSVQAAALVPPADLSELGLAFHQGARAYYQQDRPSFLVEYAEPLGLLLSVGVLGISGLWQLRLWLDARQKNRADRYNLEILKIVDRINLVQEPAQLEALRQQLFTTFKQVVMDLDEDRISPASFQSFTFTWEVAIATIHYQETRLQTDKPLQSQ